MTRLAVAFAVIALFAQDPANPFPHHETPPKGWFCWPAKSADEVTTDPHACSCLGMQDDPMCQTTETDPDTGQTSQVPASNDTAKCKVYCHKDACSCARLCKDT